MSKRALLRTPSAGLSDPSTSVPALGEARTCYMQGYIDKAITLLEAAFAESPENPEVRTLLFACYKDGGHAEKTQTMADLFLAKPAGIGETALAWQAKLAICDYAAARSVQEQVIEAACKGKISADLFPAILLVANGLADHGTDSVHADRLLAMHHAWAASLPTPSSTGADARVVRGRIRLAYVSGDFCRHPVACFLLPVLCTHDRRRFEVFCYSSTRQPADDLTGAIRQNIDHFIDITSMSDDELRRRMHSDDIHIAIDLAGHTANSRTSAFSQRLAPVQISWLGYPNTTGLAAMDFHIVDGCTDPQDEAEATAARYSEELLRMPHAFLCYGIQWDIEPAGTPPCERNGYITFASFNNGRKLNPGVLEAWAAILSAVPDSRLLLKFAGCMQQPVQDHLLNFFAGHHIQSKRVTFLPRTATAGEHIALYRDVDIALDTFPYTGTTTTFEALSQGVPVITLCGQTHRNRVSYSILKNIGYEETVTDHVEAYIRRAVELAGKPNALGVLRGVLPLLVKHAACNQPEPFTRELEELLLDACNRKGLSFAVQACEQSEQCASGGKTRRLHIGGHERHPDWEILDANASDLTDHVGNANDLSRFADNSFDALYASHVLEHFSYQNELQQVLAEWFRVLKPGGSLYAGVPDLEVLCRLFLQKEGISAEERFLLMRMIFGGQIDPWDFHKVGMYEELLAHLLAHTGFTRIRRVESFGLFRDTSNMLFHDAPISLNMLAEKPRQAADTLWLCSFPKSGNTMLRIALETYFRRPTVSVYSTSGDVSPLFGRENDNPIGYKVHEIAAVPEGGRLIYVHRDPRDVMISWFKWLHRVVPAENPEAFAAFIEREVPKWRNELEQVLSRPEPGLVLSYDDLVYKAEQTFRRIFTFIDDATPIDEEQLGKCIENNTKEKSGEWFRQGGFGALIMPIEKRTSRWAEMLSGEQIRTIESAVGEGLLNRLGYRLYDNSSGNNPPG